MMIVRHLLICIDQHFATGGNTVTQMGAQWHILLSFCGPQCIFMLKPVAVIFSSELTGLLHNFSKHVVF